MSYSNWRQCHKKYLINTTAIIIGIVACVLRVEADDSLLTLREAEQFALDSDSLIQSFSASAEAINLQSIADGQLSDPKLKVGAMNFPADTFNRGQEPMTQLQIGVQQMFPRGRSLKYNKNKTEALSGIEMAREADRQLAVIQNVRKAYLELYFQLQSKKILSQNEDLFTQLLDITQRQYAVGRDSQHDVLRAQLELSLLQDKLFEIEGLKIAAISNLAKWINDDQASRPLPETLPVIPSIPSLATITEGLPDHPQIHIQDRLVDVNKHQISIAKEQYKPGWMIDVTYGERTGSNLNGSGRADFFSAMLMVDIPLFTNKRQDKRLASSQKKHLASKFNRTDRLKELIQVTRQKHARWEQLQERYKLYESRTLIEAAQNSEATLNAYQSDVADFTTLMRAKLTELNTQLAMLRLRVEQAKVQAELLYFLGDKS